MMIRFPLPFLWLLLPLGATACRSTQAPNELPTLHYVGSSTVGLFVHDAEPSYGRAHFDLDTEAESSGGETAILEGRADLAGVARQPSPAVLAKGVSATLLGQDAIAVIVHAGNPVTDLSKSELAQIFTGKATNWSAFGGPDEPIHPLIVGPSSATRSVFRSAVLGAMNYCDCNIVEPDPAIVTAVAEDPGAIATISFSFLDKRAAVRAIAIDGEAPSPTNTSYPITRPLYLLWWRGRVRVQHFIEWTAGDEARDILLSRFTLAHGEAR